MMHRPTQKLNDISNERNRAKSVLHVTAAIPVNERKAQIDHYMTSYIEEIKADC